MYNRGTRYLEKGNPLKALQFFKKQAITHSFKELHLNMGNSYRNLMQPRKAMEQYMLANDPAVPFADGKFTSAYPLALNNIGLLHYAGGDDTSAITYYKSALTLDPLHYDAIWNYASALLRSTQCSSDVGWKAYEYRFKRSNVKNVLDDSLPIWNGLDSGDAIVVQTEQGLGDKIMFGRYLPLLAAKFSSVYVICHPSLDCLFSDYICIRSLAEAPSNACTIAQCSLAGIFGIVSEKWLEGKFEADSFDPKKFNVGVVWSGSTTHANNHNRSCPKHYFSQLANSNTMLYGLNPDDSTGKNITSIASKDWTSTAEAILGLDCVVSVDTSIVHLCGTLGIPCIMIQPTWETDFRWGKPGEQNVWYKSVEVLDNPGWDKVMDTVAKKLDERRSALRIRIMTGSTEGQEKINKEIKCTEK
jgi:hypothetical protein